LSPSDLLIKKLPVAQRRAVGNERADSRSAVDDEPDQGIGEISTGADDEQQNN